MLQLSVIYVLRVFLEGVQWVHIGCFSDALGSVQVLRQHVWGGGGAEPQCWYCWRFGGRWGGQNADMLTLGRERVGELKHRASICGQILEVINKLMNFFLNHALISLNTPQNIFLTIIEKYILIIWNISWKSSSNSPSVQVLRQQIRGGWGVKACADTADAGGGGGSKIWEKLLT